MPDFFPYGPVKKGREMKKLKKVYIEITNVCNLSCAFCPGTSRKPGYMSAEKFGLVLSKLRGFTDFIYLHVMGEPLLHPELAGCLEACASSGFKVNITTNGRLIAEKSDILLACGALRQVNFSLHSQEREKDLPRLGKYFMDIFAFAEKALASGGIYISLRLWNLTSEASAEYNKLVIGELEHRFRPGFSISEALRKEKRITIRDRLYLNSAEVFEWPSRKPEEAGDEGFCLGLRDQAAILVDGTVVPCCLDSDGKIPLGNIFKEDFAHILHGERGNALYEGFSKRRAVEELCRRCSYRNRFSI